MPYYFEWLPLTLRGMVCVGNEVVVETSILCRKLQNRDSTEVVTNIDGVFLHIRNVGWCCLEIGARIISMWLRFLLHKLNLHIGFLLEMCDGHGPF